jgi:hypothetical protein
MKHFYVVVEPFEILNLLTLNGVQEVNEHGTVTFSGIIEPELEEEYIKMSLSSTWAKVLEVDAQGDEKLYFHGVVTSIDISSEGNLKTIFVTLKTGTYLMDTAIHTRSYQTPSMTYDEVLSSYTKDYHKSDFLMKKGKGESINHLIMQYRETDWSFTKRVSSHLNTVIIPECSLEGVKYFFGIKESGAVDTIKTSTYKMQKDATEYHVKMQKGLSLFEADAIYYLYCTREIYRLGEQINFNDKPMYIYKIETKHNKGELLHTYYLKSLNGFLVAKTFNANAIGVSFYSVITSVEKDIVQISINDDENKVGCGSRWFPYSTVYSTSDGTGWYCMPEVGDAVRMYIPTEDEAKSYIISSTHLSSSSSDERVNPDFKSIMNKQKKEVLFKPDSLIFTNNNGMSIEILDNEGIKIISDKAIIFESDEAIEMTSTQSTVTVSSPQSITFNQGDTTTQLKKNIAFNGAQIHLD